MITRSDSLHKYFLLAIESYVGEGYYMYKALVVFVFFFYCHCVDITNIYCLVLRIWCLYGGDHGVTIHERE